MNFKRISALALVSALLVSVLLCAVACDGGNTEEETTAAQTEAATTAQTEATTAEQTTEEVTTDDGKVTYTVTVVDANGAPVAGVAVQFCDDNGCRMPVATNEQGVVTLTDVESNFHVTIASVPAGYAADTNEYYFDGELSMTVTLIAAE